VLTILHAVVESFTRVFVYDEDGGSNRQSGQRRYQLLVTLRDRFGLASSRQMQQEESCTTQKAPLCFVCVYFC
jgi:hypothetical protein